MSVLVPFTNPAIYASSSPLTCKNSFLIACKNAASKDTILTRLANVIITTIRTLYNVHRIWERYFQILPPIFQPAKRSVHALSSCIERLTKS